MILAFFFISCVNGNDLWLARQGNDLNYHFSAHQPYHVGSTHKCNMVVHDIVPIAISQAVIDDPQLILFTIQTFLYYLLQDKHPFFFFTSTILLMSIVTVWLRLHGSPMEGRLPQILPLLVILSYLGAFNFLPVPRAQVILQCVSQSAYACLHKFANERAPYVLFLLAYVLQDYFWAFEMFVIITTVLATRLAVN